MKFEKQITSAVKRCFFSVEPRRRRRRLKGIHSRSDTNRTGAEGLSFYYPRLLHCLNQMLAVVLLSQHRISSSKTVRPRAPCGARCIGHVVSLTTSNHVLFLTHDISYQQLKKTCYLPIITAMLFTSLCATAIIGTLVAGLNA